jgi:hypothetical protein
MGASYACMVNLVVGTYRGLCALQLITGVTIRYDQHIGLVPRFKQLLEVAIYKKSQFLFADVYALRVAVSL